MIPYEELNAAEAKFPIPNFVDWYLNRFPKKIFNIIASVIFGAGLFFTIFKSKRPLILIPTIMFCGMVLIGGTMHTIAWYMKRSTLKKRAEYLGLTLEEYLNLL